MQLLTIVTQPLLNLRSRETYMPSIQISLVVSFKNRMLYLGRLSVKNRASAVKHFVKNAATELVFFVQNSLTRGRHYTDVKYNCKW